MTYEVTSLSYIFENHPSKLSQLNFFWLTPCCMMQRGVKFKFKELSEFETEIKNISGCESGAHKGVIYEKKRPKNLALLYL
jgi:hypothetical protein